MRSIDVCRPACRKAERSGDIRRCEVPRLLQLEHSPVTAAVLVTVDVPGSPAPIVAGEGGGPPPAATPAWGACPGFPRPPPGGRGPWAPTGGGGAEGAAGPLC